MRKKLLVSLEMVFGLVDWFIVTACEYLSFSMNYFLYFDFLELHLNLIPLFSTKSPLKFVCRLLS